MPRKKVRVANSERLISRSIYENIVAKEVMPPCSSCTRSKEVCKLRAGQGSCVRCTAGGRRCDLFLTREDGVYPFAS